MGVIANERKLARIWNMFWTLKEFSYEFKGNQGCSVGVRNILWKLKGNSKNIKEISVTFRTCL